jgi:hypothetical protein
MQSRVWYGNERSTSSVSSARQRQVLFSQFVVTSSRSVCVSVLVSIFVYVNVYIYIFRCIYIYKYIFISE